MSSKLRFWPRVAQLSNCWNRAVCSNDPIVWPEGGLVSVSAMYTGASRLCMHKAWRK
jgi:hypothetical protein